MGQVPRWAVGALALALLAGAGCRRVVLPVRSRGPNAPAADLSRPLRLSYEGSRGDLREPLTLAQLMARSAGGTWVALAPKPLEYLKWQPDSRSSDTLTVAKALEAVRNAGTPLAWETKNGYTLLYFGTPQQLAGIRAHPPLKISGLYLAAGTGAALLDAVGDLWQISIRPDPDLLKPRDALIAARKRQQEEEKDSAEAAGPLTLSPYQRFADQSGDETDREPALVEFKVVDRLDLEDLLHRLAAIFGGECVESARQTWEIRPFSDARKVAAEIERLRGIAAEHTEGEGTSYASRAQGEEEEGAEIGPVRSETQAAMEGLAVLGRPALPALADFLDPQKPELAQAALQILGDLPFAQVDRTLFAFGRQLQGPLKGRAAAARPALQAALVRVVSHRSGSQAATWLGDAARDERVAPAARMRARMVLLARGDLAPFARAARRALLPVGGPEFALASPPTPPAGARPGPPGEPPPDAITPLATTVGPDGSAWAVFLSGRYGDPDDLWLARGRDGRWQEFLFTGQSYPRPSQGSYPGYGERPKPGGCVVEVKSDQVTLRPPDLPLAAQEAGIRQALETSGSPSQKQRQQLYEQYARIRERAASQMEHAITLSLADLRRDSDGDGLPDLVERRLGTDPLKADTDGDGVPDGRDANSLARPDPHPSDRSRLLQLVFTALCAGDPSRDAILVVLDPAYWQEFYGARGRVICISKEEFQRRTAQLGAMRVIQFGGPANAEATILRKDGPCLYNDDRSKAEVHFWQWVPASANPYEMMRGMTLTNGPVDLIARFERRGDWQLIAVKPWRVDTAGRAAARLLRRRIYGVMGGL
jgi:hypothetical protein